MAAANFNEHLVPAMPCESEPMRRALIDTGIHSYTEYRKELERQWKSLIGQSQEDPVGGASVNVGLQPIQGPSYFSSGTFIPFDQAALKEYEMFKQFFSEVPQPLQHIWLTDFVGASGQSLIARWKDVSDNYHTPRPVNWTGNSRVIKTATPESYICPVVVDGSTCLAVLSSDNISRRRHMDRHFKGVYLCPGVCEEPWFHTLEALQRHLGQEAHGACRNYYNPAVNYRVNDHRWLECPELMDMESLPEDDPLHEYIIDNAQYLPVD